ncbi:MAG TPA: hypothetical protein VHB02_03865 [Acidimicrobiales bacterium]|nr:hypothetical protein [Acidimicrobiales bacterium]
MTSFWIVTALVLVNVFVVPWLHWYRLLAAALRRRHDARWAEAEVGLYAARTDLELRRFRQAVHQDAAETRADLDRRLRGGDR